GTARPVVARMSAATAAEAGAADGGKVVVSTAAGAVTADVRVTDMPNRVVWLPAHSSGCEVRRQLRAGHGTLVSLRRQHWTWRAPRPRPTRRWPASTASRGG